MSFQIFRLVRKRHPQKQGQHIDHEKAAQTPPYTPQSRIDICQKIPVAVGGITK